MRGWFVILAVLGFVAAACSSEPAASTDYQELEQRLAAVEEGVDQIASQIGSQSWTNPSEPVQLWVEPATVPAEVGVVTVTVHGEGFISTSGIWVMPCPEVGAEVDPSNWPEPQPTQEGEMIDVSPCPDSSMQDHRIDVSTAEFTIELDVPITAAAINEGGIVITTGDIWLPVWANVLLEVSPPSTVSAIGFDWRIEDVGGYITYPSAYDDGYVALLDGLVASSSDGITWEVWDNQPGGGDLQFPCGTQSGLAYHSGNLIFVGHGYEDPDTTANPLTPRIFLAQPDRSWAEIAVEPGSEDPIGHYPLISVNGETLVVSTNQGAWSVTADGAPAFDSIDQGLVGRQWDHTVEPLWIGIEPPPTEELLAIEQNDGTMVAIDMKGNAWTSSNGEDWNQTARIAVERDCAEGTTDGATPGNLEAGPLGWFAAGSNCTNSVIWHSADGTNWHTIDNIEGMDAFGIMVPFPPVFLIETERILIYAKQITGLPTSVWVGTTTG